MNSRVCRRAAAIALWYGNIFLFASLDSEPSIETSAVYYLPTPPERTQVRMLNLIFYISFDFYSHPHGCIVDSQKANVSLSSPPPSSI